MNTTDTDDDVEAINDKDRRFRKKIRADERSREYMTALLHRFRANVKRNESGCWEWTGARHRTGYGAILAFRKQWKAHRLSYYLFRQAVDNPKLCICHRCDNPPCVNPEHLFLGTFNDNRQDTVRKGRQSRGEDSGRNKITELDVLNIVRRFHDEDVSQTDLGREYGITGAAVGHILRGNAWRHVTGIEPVKACAVDLNTIPEERLRRRSRYCSDECAAAGRRKRPAIKAKEVRDGA